MTTLDLLNTIRIAGQFLDEVGKIGQSIYSNNPYIRDEIDPCKAKKLEKELEINENATLHDVKCTPVDRINSAIDKI